MARSGMFGDLNAVSGRYRDSVHLCAFPTADASLIDGELEDTMSIAQRVSSMVLALRRKVNIKVRQPLTKILIPVLDEKTGRHIEKVRSLIMNEVNVKRSRAGRRRRAGLITKRIKPNFKTLGPQLRQADEADSGGARGIAFARSGSQPSRRAPASSLDLGGRTVAR